MKLPLNVVGTHWEFHNDELVMVALLAWYGHKRFLPPVGQGLEVQFYRSTEAAQAAIAADKAQLLVGIGGGDWDEHKKEGRLADECGATVAADQLGVRANPELQLILDYALRADREAGQKHFELAEMLKTLHGWSDLAPMRIMHFGLSCLGAVRNRESGKPAGDRGVEFESIVGAWLERQRQEGTEDRLLKLIVSELKRWSAKPEEILPFELPALVAVLNTHGRRSAEEIMAMVEAVLDARVARSYDFMVRCHGEAKTRTRVLEVGGLRVGFATSDSRSMGAYLRAQGKCDLVVLQKSTGNVNIFSGSEPAKAIMPKVAREVLRAECFACGEGGEELYERMADFEALVASGQGRDLLGVPWYFHLEAGALHNGSSTHPDVAPTRLDIPDIARAIAAVIRQQPDRTGGG